MTGMKKLPLLNEHFGSKFSVSILDLFVSFTMKSKRVHLIIFAGCEIININDYRSLYYWMKSGSFYS